MFQADSDVMHQVSQRYEEQIAEVWAIIHELQRTLEPLQDGGWVGEGADAFLTVMGNDAFAVLRKIVDYLEYSHQVADETVSLIEASVQLIHSKCRY